MSGTRTPPKATRMNENERLLIPQDSDTASDRILSDSDTANVLITSRKLKRKQGDLQMAELRDLLDAFTKTQNTKFDDLTSAMKLLQEETAEMKRSFTFMSNRYDEVLENVVKIQKDNSAYKVRVELLEQKVEFLERKARSTTIELRNVPQSPDETKEKITQIVARAGEILQQPILISDIRDTYRLKAKNKTNCPIVVEFTSIAMKENIIQKAKLFNKGNKENKLNSSHLKISGPTQPVYVSECLTPYAKKLFYLARQHAKKYSFTGCWHSFGKIYMKKSDDRPTIRIDNEDDFLKLTQA